MPPSLSHRVARMTGRDPGEHHRASTPLELLFDLTFVVGFGTAANEFAHYLSLGEVRSSLIGFCFSVFAITWAWINFSWFASAYDTDDWVFRLLTLLQMVGVLVLSLGIASLFDSIARHEAVDNGVMVAGYVVMRVAMVAQWGRAAHEDPSRRSASRVYMSTILVAQAGWVGLVFAHVHIGAMLALAVPLIAIELLGPLIAETRYSGTPWHPHHIAERYGLLVIICLGEAILGTVAALGAVVGPSGAGWSVKAAVIGVAGVTLTFGMWWIYFVVPGAEILARRRSRSFGWGYGHILIFGAVVATGAGLHVAAFYVEHHTKLSAFDTLLTTAIPVAIYVLGIFVLYAYLTGSIDPFYYALIGLSALVLATPVVMAGIGVAPEWCLLVLSLVPWITVVGYETIGRRHNAQVLAALEDFGQA